MARIFLVEDDVCTQSLLKAILRARSHEVVGIADNEEGAIAGILSTKPELCLIDVHLSGAGTGLNVAEFILENLGIPVIVMSGDDQPTLTYSVRPEAGQSGQPHARDRSGVECEIRLKILRGDDPTRLGASAIGRDLGSHAPINPSVLCP